MRLAPVTLGTLLHLAVLTLLPVAPLMLTMCRVALPRVRCGRLTASPATKPRQETA